MLIHANESFETARLLQELDDEPRIHFLNAVRAYGDAENSDRKVRLIEAVIRTSRSIANDPGIMPEDVQETVVCVMERYRAFGPPRANVQPTSYGDARNMIKAYFF